jgi:hypothetical protein
MMNWGLDVIGLLNDELRWRLDKPIYMMDVDETTNEILFIVQKED